MMFVLNTDWHGLNGGGFGIKNLDMSRDDNIEDCLKVLVKDINET